MNTNFKIGDVVQLKSGGPVMTVSRLEKRSLVECIWFDMANSGPHIKEFVKETLVPEGKPWATNKTIQ